MLGSRALLTSALLSRASAATAGAGPVDFLFSDLGWTGKPTDADYPNRHFAPRVLSPCNLERTIPFVPAGANGGSGRRAIESAGDIILANGDGALDSFLRHAVDGRRVHVLTGPRNGDFAAFETLFKGTAAAWANADQQRLALSLRDASWKLDQVLPRAIYGGAGGLDGGIDLQGKYRPKALGELYNVTPVLVDALRQIYQVNDGRIAQLIGAYDGGAPYTPAGDVADILAAAPAPGTCVTQLSGGYLRLGTAPVKGLTIDVKGDAPGGVYADRAADIVFRIIHDMMGFDDGMFETWTFDALRDTLKGPIGVYVGIEPVTGAQVVDQVMAGIDGWWGPNLQDRIEVGLSGLPNAVPQCTLSDRDILEFEMLPLPEAIDPAIWRFSVGFQRNWTPMTTNEIAQSIVTGDPDRLAFLQQEYRFVTHEEIDVRSQYQQARELVLLSSYAQQAHAEALLESLVERFTTRRSLARLRTKRKGQKIPPGTTLRVDHARFGLAGGANTLVVKQAIDAEAIEAELDVFW